MKTPKLLNLDVNFLIVFGLDALRPLLAKCIGETASLIVFVGALALFVISVFVAKFVYKMELTKAVIDSKYDYVFLIIAIVGGLIAYFTGARLFFWIFMIVFALFAVFRTKDKE